MTKEIVERLKDDYFKQLSQDQNEPSDHSYGLLRSDGEGLWTTLSLECAYLRARYWNALNEWRHNSNRYIPGLLINGKFREIQENSPFFFVKTFEDCSVFAVEPHKEIRARQHLFLEGWTVTDYQYDAELKIVRITAVR